MNVKINIPRAEVRDFCRRREIRKMALFGSVLREDFRLESDVDVLVEFNPGARVGMIGLAGMELELGRILGRKVEMHTFKGLNPHFREEVLAAAESIYDAA